MACRVPIGGFHRTCVISAGINSPPKVGFVRAKQQQAVRSVKVKMAYSQGAAASPASCAGSFYQLLSVSPDASASDLKKAYRRQALRYHPDVCPPAEKEECSRMFVEIRAAYETLSDPVLRQDYDWRLQNNLDLSDSGRRSQINNWNLWEAQLVELIRKSNCSNEYTWGGRMRRRNQRTPNASAAI